MRVLIYLTLTHWGRVTHICVVNLTIIGWDNGLSPGRRQAIIWTIDGILLVGPLGTNFSEILGKIHKFWLKKMHLKTSSAKWRPFCLGLNVLITLQHISPFKLLWCWNRNIRGNYLDSMAADGLPSCVARLSPVIILVVYDLFVVVNFDALPQASDIWIEKRPAVFLCWMHNSNPKSQTPNRQLTEWPLTNPLSLYRKQFPYVHMDELSEQLILTGTASNNLC